MFCHLELTKTNDTYSQKLETERYQQKEMITLSWKVKELNDLGESGRQVYAEIKALTSRMQVREGSRQENIPRILQTIRQKTEFSKMRDCSGFLQIGSHIITEMVKRKMKVAGNDTILLMLCEY